MIYEDKKILLEVIYGPNQDNPSFFTDKAFKKIQEWDPDFSIFCGDFNVVLDPNIDTKNYLHTNNPMAMEALKDQIQQNNLVDIWRELHPQDKTFTWQKYNENKQSRLDFFLVSASLLPFVQKADIKPGFCSDHSAIELEIDFSKFERGRGFWKFNSSLLQDPNYLTLIKDTIKRVVAQYAIVDGNDNFYENATKEMLEEFYAAANPEILQHISLKINPQSFLDVLLMEIRRVTICFSSKKKKERIKKEEELINEIEIIEAKIAAQENEAAFQVLNTNLLAKKLELENIFAIQAQGAFVRARAQYKLEGEKPSRLFCSLEKHNSIQKYIPKLVIEKQDQKHELTDQKKIEHEIYNYYKDLFAEKPIENTSIEEFLPFEAVCPRLSETQKEKMEGMITVEEMTKYLKSTKNNKSPGSSGFTNEFFKFFWINLKIFISKAINFGFEMGMLSITQRLGIITLIPKGDKDKTFLKNWRPLTLLNSIYKLVSGCIAERIKPHLDTIVHEDQKGFVSGRFIGEAVRTTFDILQWAKDNNKTGVLLLIDFEKAYDSLSFSFIKKCLLYFNFGQNMIKWIDILLNNFWAVINHCGNISQKFSIGRGARQGDPIASYIFIICIEILAIKLRCDEGIKGFKVENLSHLLELYADDCTIFLESCEDNLRKTLDILNLFYRISGLKISISKTKAIWFGKGHANTHRLCPDLTLDWDTRFRLLGINFTNNLEGMDDNYDIKVDEIRKVYNCWINRTMSVYGKVVIIKTLALSKLNLLATVLPNLDKNQLKKLETLTYQFLWGNKPDKVSRDHTKLPEKAGGLGVLDIKSFWLSLKFSWIKRATITNAFWPNILMKEVNKILDFNVSLSDFLQFGPNLLANIGKKINNRFWQQILCNVNPFMQGAIYCYPENISIAPIWDNPLFTRNNKPLKRSQFSNISSKIKIMSDFYNPGTNILLTKIQLEERFNIIMSEELYIELRYIFKNACRSLGLVDSFFPSTHLPAQPLLIKMANIVKKGCNAYYRFLRKSINMSINLVDRERRWHNELGCVFGIDYWNKIYALTAGIKNENKMKYVQFQINRNSLFTNYKVNKFKPNVSPGCTLCELEEVNDPPSELISHLFFDCSQVLNIWIEVKNWLRTININLPLDRNILLFGYLEENSNSVSNYLILCVKYYIWKTKLQFQQLSFLALQNFFKNKMDDLRNAFLYEDKLYKFEPFVVVYNSLLSLE